MSNFTEISNNKIYRINVFDDGNQNLENRIINTWILIGTNNKGKIKLRNFYDREIILESISAWKVKSLNNSKKIDK